MNWRGPAFGSPGRRQCCFHRVDDIGAPTPELDIFLDSFAASRLPCVLSVIPARISAEVASYIRAHENFFVFQHGYNHVNRAGEAPNEFPDGFGYGLTLARLAEGRRILEDRIGQAVVGYTPPWNRASRTALAALAELGFRIVSCGAGARLNTSLIEMHAKVDTIKSYRPLAMRNQADILDLVERQSLHGKVFGVVYHIPGLMADDVRSLSDIVKRLAPMTFGAANWIALLRPQ